MTCCHRYIIYPGGQCGSSSYSNRVDPFAALCWALGIVLANTWPCPLDRHNSTAEQAAWPYKVLLGLILNEDALPPPPFLSRYVIYLSAASKPAYFSSSGDQRPAGGPNAAGQQQWAAGVTRPQQQRHQRRPRQTHETELRTEWGQLKRVRARLTPTRDSDGSWQGE